MHISAPKVTLEDKVVERIARSLQQSISGRLIVSEWMLVVRSVEAEVLKALRAQQESGNG